MKAPRGRGFIRLITQAPWLKTSVHGVCTPIQSLQYHRQKGIKMFEGLLQPTHMLVIFGIALLVFGPKKLPELGKGLGESIRGFKSAMAAKEETNTPATSDPETKK